MIASLALSMIAPVQMKDPWEIWVKLKGSKPQQIYIKARPMRIFVGIYRQVSDIRRTKSQHCLAAVFVESLEARC